MNMAGDNVVRMPADELERFMADVFAGLGVPSDEARTCARVLIESDKRGIDSHGINRCKPIYYDRIRAGTQETTTQIEVVRDRRAIAVLDGHNGMGHVVATRGMELAIEKARENGIGMVAVRHSTHFGIAGYYALMAIEADMIGIVGCNARPSVAPTFGVANMLGTNPLTFGMPSDEAFPFVLDGATSVAQRGTVEYYAREGRSLPEGWMIDHEGRPCTDAEQVLKDLVGGRAAFLPLGGAGEDGAGYKGYGYATVVEILSSALQAGNFLWGLSGLDGEKRAPIELGHFFIAVDIASFIEPASFKKTVGEIVRALRNSAKAPGCDRIYTAGEKEFLAWEDRRTNGIPLPVSVQRDMTAMRDELELTTYRFPWEGRR